MAMLLWPRDGDRDPLDSAPESVVPAVGTTSGPELAIEAVEPVISRSPSWEFSPEEVIDNPDCNFTAGLGNADDSAIYVLSGEAGARFAVLDGGGTVFGGELPFDPNDYRIGKRADGTVVAGLADLRLNSKVFRPPEAPEPVHIYRDGQLVYENDKAWRFGVASDGSSFYVIEPLAGEASRLVVRDLDAGEEHHYDLGIEFSSPDAYEVPYVSFYSTDGAEVMFWPPQELEDTPRGDYWFYPTDGRPARVVRIESVDIPRRPGASADLLDAQQVRVERILRGGALRPVKDRVYFESSEVAYYLVDRRTTDRQEFEVVKTRYQRYGESGGPERTDQWSRTIPGRLLGSMVLSNNGDWLALQDGGRVWALDAATGDIVFAFPTTEDLGLQVPPHLRGETYPGRRVDHIGHAYDVAALARLRSVLGPDATVNDVGGIGGFGFRGNRLMLYHVVGRGQHSRGFYDAFDLSKVGVHGGPEFRVEADGGCGTGDFVRGLQVHDGRLTYLTSRR